MSRKLRKYFWQGKESNMPEEIARTKIIGLKNTRIQSLKIKGLTSKHVVIKSLTLKDVTFHRVKS
jgi:hypothetical protein